MNRQPGATCGENHEWFCPHCWTRKRYKLGDETRRCSRCKYTFHDFSGSWLNQGGLSWVQWLWLVKLFDLGNSTRRTIKEMKVAYRTAYRSLSTVRLVILAHASDAENFLRGAVEVDEACFGGPPKAA